MNIEETENLWGSDIPWLEGLREKGRQSFKKTGWPNAKTEAWKYSFFPQTIINTFEKDTSVCECSHEHCHDYNLPFDVYPINICDGKVHIHGHDFPDGIIVKSLVEAIYDNDAKKYLSKSFDMENFPFAAFNTAFIEQGLLIIFERGYCADKPIYIRYNHKKNNTLCILRNIFILEKDASASIIEHSDTEKNISFFDNIVNEVYLSENAQLQHYRLQEKNEKTYSVTFNSVECRKNSKYTQFCAQKECAVTRSESLINLLQKESQAEVNGIYKINESGTCDMTTNIRHLTENTYSSQLVKGVVNGKGKGVFQGQIHIAPQAVQTQGYQLHKALLLSDEGEIDCKPELEIFADDVQCSHGATCGDLDKEQIFYMCSRGIPEDEARNMLIQAHLLEAINKINDENIRSWIQNLFSAEI